MIDNSLEFGMHNRHMKLSSFGTLIQKIIIYKQETKSQSWEQRRTSKCDVKLHFNFLTFKNL